MLQVRPAATATLQVPRLTENAVGSSTFTAPIVSGAVPLLDTVSDFVTGLPTLVLPRSSEADLMAIWLPVPVPVRPTVRGPTGSLLGTDRLAVLVPRAVGVNLTATTQLAPGATEAQPAPLVVV